MVERWSIPYLNYPKAMPVSLSIKNVGLALFIIPSELLPMVYTIAKRNGGVCKVVAVL